MPVPLMMTLHSTLLLHDDSLPNYWKCYWIQHGALIVKLSDWVGNHVPISTGMQIKDHAKYVCRRGTSLLSLCWHSRLLADLGPKIGFMQSLCFLHPLHYRVGRRSVQRNDPGRNVCSQQARLMRSHPPSAKE